MEFASGEELLAFCNQKDREEIDILIFVSGSPEAKKIVEPKAVLLRDRNVTRRVPADDIYYIESNNRKIIVHMHDEIIECYGKIGELERELQEGFFRIHKGYLVNMKYVEGYNRTEVRVKNGNCLLLSKYKYQDFEKAYLQFVSTDK
ncbi:MAG: LytTR family transcriptional regulator [Lachnospiraceae bacterium]|nr:LytTR family transcriptional regulator [Lachnospiraceae bacterium]